MRGTTKYIDPNAGTIILIRCLHFCIPLQLFTWDQKQSSDEYQRHSRANPFDPGHADGPPSFHTGSANTALDFTAAEAFVAYNRTMHSDNTPVRPYYGRFYRLALYPPMRQLDRSLARWANQKYKNLAGICAGRRTGSRGSQDAIRNCRIRMSVRWASPSKLLLLQTSVLAWSAHRGILAFAYRSER